MHCFSRLAFVFAISFAPLAVAVDVDGGKYFEQHVRPLLAGKCIKCHGAEKQEGGLRLDSLESMLEGGDSGPAIVPGAAAESLLVEAVRYESFEMPPTGQLPREEIAPLVEWIAGGAAWPEHGEPLRAISGGISETDRQWWAFQPLACDDIPEFDGDQWSRTGIDRFIYRRLADQGMTPAPPAPKQQLVRRVYYDLLGLPPTPAETDAFVHNASPDAWEELIDSLLDDPRYGEHWGRYWLDLVRYAESDGWNQDAYRPHIWRYRDYVVEAFNEDKPYPQFVREQLAGDEIPGDDPAALVATGYLRLGIYEYNQRDARSLWNDVLNEVTDVTADVFIGMGMACARCHDHKFDPILQQDYFQLRAFFEPLVWRDDVPMATQQQRSDYEAAHTAWKEASADVHAEIDALLKPYHDRKWQTTVDKFPLDIQACFHKPVAQRTSWEHQMAYLVERQFEEEGGGPLSAITKEDKATYESLQERLAAFDHLKPQPLPALMTAADFPGPISPTIIPDAPEPAAVSPGYLTVLRDTAAPEPHGASRGFPPEPQGASRGFSSEPQGASRGFPSEPQGASRGFSPEPQGASRGFPSEPHGASRGFPSEPQGASRGFPSEPQGASRGFPSEPHGASRGFSPEPHGTGRRTALAQWIGHPENPLTTRVIVNRVWQQHFGKGIVPTPSDFGRLGLPPTHPELLDWLTGTFIEDGWSLKKLHKRILMSAAWQQSSSHPRAEEYQEKDPDDALLWRFPVRRLSAEQIRDAMLVASGELDPSVGGPSVDGAVPRRSLYVKVYRNNLDTFLQLFDVANGLKSVAERNRTTTPVQSLMMINGAWTLGRAERFADRLREGDSTTDDTLTRAFRIAWGREPTPGERQQSVQFVGDPVSDDRLVDFCHVLLNSNEFLYVD